MASTPEGSDRKAWEAWYRLAREALACRHQEAIEYANLRFVEEQNHAMLRGDAAGGRLGKHA